GPSTGRGASAPARRGGRDRPRAARPRSRRGLSPRRAPASWLAPEDPIPDRAEGVDLRQELGEGRDVVVALEEDRPGPDLPPRILAQPVDRVADGLTMRVDAQSVRAQEVARHMELRHALRRDAIDVVDGVEAEVPAVYEDVVHVEEELRVGALEDLDDEA